MIYHRILKIVPCTVWGFPNGSVVKNPPAMQETQVWSLGQEDPLEEEEMATHSSILAWKIPRTEEPGVLRSMGLQKVRHDWATAHTYTLYCRTLLFIHSIYNGLRLLIPSHHSWISLVRACECTCMCVCAKFWTILPPTQGCVSTTTDTIPNRSNDCPVALLYSHPLPSYREKTFIHVSLKKLFDLLESHVYVFLEEGMATHSSILAWRIPWTEEPGGLQFMGSQRVGHDWSDLACTHTCIIIFR